MCNFQIETDEELYKKRTENFHRIGQAVGTGDVTAGIVEILEGTDKEMLVARYTILKGTDMK